MIYEVDFLIAAKKEWDGLDPAIRGQFKKKLEKLRHNPRVPERRASVRTHKGRSIYLNLEHLSLIG